MTYPKTLATAVLAAALMVPIGASAGLQGDGTWKVEPGDTLYAVARKLAPGNSAKQAKLRKHMVENSPNAFVNGDPGRMEVGKTLNLPADAGKVDTNDVGDIELSTTPMPASKPPSGGGAAAPEVTPDMSFKERVEAKRKAREEAEKKTQLERRQQEMAAEQERKAEAARRAEAESRRAEQERQRQQQQAAERARQEKARREAAAQASQPKPAPKPQTAAEDVKNPYVLCPSLDHSGRCGYWR
ncbi:MAG: hypothetical protein ACQES2_08015 [Pseudomonadota bacterium]